MVVLFLMLKSPLFCSFKLSRDYLLGQAEAYGILCKIFTSCKTDEKINIEFLTKFYTVLNYGLKVPQFFNSETSPPSNSDSVIVTSFSLSLL